MLQVSGHDSASTPPVGSPRFLMAQSPGPNSRFPATRMGGRPSALLSSSPAPPSADLRPSLGVKNLPSPSKSAGPFPHRNARPAGQLHSPSPDVAARSPFQFPGNRPGNLAAMPMGGRGNSGRGVVPQGRPRLPINPSRVKPPRVLSTPSRDQKPTPLGLPRGGGGSKPNVFDQMRQRANTEPISQAGWKSKLEGQQATDPEDLQSVLEGAGMEKYIAVFQQHEVGTDQVVLCTCVVQSVGDYMWMCCPVCW